MDRCPTRVENISAPKDMDSNTKQQSNGFGVDRLDVSELDSAHEVKPELICASAPSILVTRGSGCVPIPKLIVLTRCSEGRVNQLALEGWCMITNETMPTLLPLSPSQFKPKHKRDHGCGPPWADAAVTQRDHPILTQVLRFAPS